jgi:hypothetical protein
MGPFILGGNIMKQDNLKITVEITQGTYREIADRARTTIGMGKGDKVISLNYVRKMYLCEHSPIRIRNFLIRIENVPSWLSVHFVRHHVGYTPFVSTQRDDRNPTIIDRDEEKQGNLVTLEIYANVQAIIAVSRKRLCNCAHPRAKALWSQVIQKLGEVDEVIPKIAVPDCVYRGWCFEHKSCNYHQSQGFEKAINEYREGINGWRMQ